MASNKTNKKNRVNLSILKYFFIFILLTLSFFAGKQSQSNYSFIINKADIVNSTNEDINDLKEYTNEDFGISFKYPSDYTLKFNPVYLGKYPSIKLEKNTKFYALSPYGSDNEHAEGMIINFMYLPRHDSDKFYNLEIGGILSKYTDSKPIDSHLYPDQGRVYIPVNGESKDQLVVQWNVGPLNLSFSQKLEYMKDYHDILNTIKFL